MSCATVLKGLIALAVLGVGMQAAPPAPGTAPARPMPLPGYPQTRPEASNYQETSRYDDVIAFMEAAARANPEIHLTTYGFSYEGRALPLAVIGAPAATPEAVRATGKTRVFVQANIHAGEVEGKEAALMLLRAIAKGEHAEWLKNTVLLIAPIYNADGNERINVRNRGPQHGPVGGMGTRHNAQDMDLNRDATKLETAEGRSMARLMTQYDPHVALDLHTTDGSDHGYYLTYEAPGNPSTAPQVSALVRDKLLPTVTKAVKDKHNWNLFYYGGPGDRPERAWYGDDDLYKSRYHHNYFGMRNRLGVLSEAYSYATFEDRINATYWFVEEIINWAAANGDAIRKATAEADSQSIIGTQQTVRGKLVKTGEPVDIVLADCVEEPNPYVPDRPLRRRVVGSDRIERMPHYGVIEVTETSTAPRAYVMPVAEGRGAARAMAAVVDRLQAHGVKFYKSAKEFPLKGERFKIASSTLDEQEYRGGGGHKIRTLAGAWEDADATVPAGSLVIPMDQPLARLIFVLLDPRSEDSLAAWNILDPVLGATPAPAHYPILRTMNPVPTS